MRGARRRPRARRFCDLRPLPETAQRDSCATPAIIVLLSGDMAKSRWEVAFHPACETWADDLEQSDAEALLAVIRVLRDEGPTLGRPLGDSTGGKRHHTT